jgi:hypothetical protein
MRLAALCALLSAACQVEDVDDDESLSELEPPEETVQAFPGCRPNDKYCGGCSPGSCTGGQSYFICPSTGQWVFTSQCSPAVDDPVCRWRAPSCGSTPPGPSTTTTGGGDDEPPDCGGLPNCQ